MSKRRVKIEVSAKHIHLTKEDFETLFGEDEVLDVRNYLSQPNEFASNKTVEVVGPDHVFDKVRVIGPFRIYSQVEISKTDALKAGIDAPYKISGDLPGARVRVIGPKGEFVKDIAIVAKRHIHLRPKEARALKVRAGQHISISISGERSTTFDRLEVRTSDNYKKVCHIDTDEGNAAGVENSCIGTIIK